MTDESRRTRVEKKIIQWDAEIIISALRNVSLTLWNGTRDKAVVCALKFRRRRILLNYEV